MSITDDQCREALRLRGEYRTMREISEIMGLVRESLIAAVLDYQQRTGDRTGTQQTQQQAEAQS